MSRVSENENNMDGKTKRVYPYYFLLFLNDAKNRFSYIIRFCNRFSRSCPGIRLCYVEKHSAFRKKIVFDFNEQMTVDSIIYKKKNTFFAQRDNQLIIALNPLSFGDSDSVTVYYHGEPEKDQPGFSYFDISEHNGMPVLWTLSEPYGAQEWWPCKQSLSDKIDSIDIIVKTPEIYRTASNGILISENVSAGFRTMHWKHRYPIATYLVAIAVSNYEVYSDTFKFDDGRILKVENYVYPEYAQTSKEETLVTLDLIALYDSLIGEYPFSREKYGHAQFDWPGGMEHQTMSFMYNFSFDLISHELAHQWFGDCITLGSWHDIWLNEGFATYMTGLAYENLLDGFYWPIWKRANINKIVSNPGGSVYVKDTTNINAIFSSRLSYSKGAYLLHMLRWVLGDTHFFQAMRQYFNDPQIKNGFAAHEKFVEHLEAAGDTLLTEFFNDWYYGEGFPVYSLLFGPEDNGQTKLELSQTPSHSSVSFFEMPVPVRVYSAGKTDSMDFRLIHTHNNQQFFINTGFAVHEAVIDPDKWLVSKTLNITKVFSELEEQKIMVYPNPFYDKLTIATSGDLTIKEINIFNNTGETIKHYPDFPETINLAGLKAGVYTLHILTSKGKHIQKIIKL